MNYNDKLKLAKEALDSGSYDKETIEYIFPELAESEDERIRKAMTRLVKAFYDCNFPTPEGFERKDLLAWLERQDKHANFLNKIQIGDKVTRNEDGVLVNLSQLERVAKKQGSQILANSAKTCKEGQKPADKVEPKFKVGDKIIDKSFPKNVFTVTEVINDGIAYVDKNGERFTKYYDEDDWDEYELVEQKPVWSKEDEARFKSCIEVLQTSDGYDTINTKWFKSLKERYTWKPSDEQMDALDRAQAELCSTEYNKPICDLIDSLNKLREK